MQTSYAKSLSDAADAIAAWEQSPLLFVTEALQATPETWQEQALIAAATEPRMAIRSGHGVGKSTFLAWLTLHNHVTRFPAKTGTTAPTEHQLEDILWAEIGTWFKRLPGRIREQFRLTHLRLEMGGHEEESFAAGRVSRPEHPEAFAGYHSPNMLLIGDEGSGIPEPTYEVGLGAMSTPGARMALAGNPTKPSGFFFDCFNKARARWWTMRVNSEDYARARGHIDDIVALYGKDSNAYRIRVLGEFPTTSDEQVIPLDLIEEAIKRDVKPLDLYRVVWGLDVARFGDDRTALCKRQGNVVMEPLRSWRQKDTMQVAGIIADEYKRVQQVEPDLLPSEILVDVIGLGAGVVDRLNELGLPVRGINVGESASANDRYMRLRDELWFKGREWFQRRDCKLPDDRGLVAELTAPTYTHSSAGKLIVESKQDMKDRGMQSPDLADAFLLTLAGGLDRRPEEEMDRYAIKRRRSGGWMSA